jgi:hypothetical protein
MLKVFIVYKEPDDLESHTQVKIDNVNLIPYSKSL